MKTYLRHFLIGITLFVLLFIISLFISQSSIVNNVKDITTLSLLVMIGLMLLAGILDGFNPCAFSTLLIWIGFLLNNFVNQVDDEKDIKNKQRTIHAFAAFYSLGILSVYFLFGTGLLMIGDVINVSVIPLITRIAGLMIVILGLLTLRDSLTKSRNKFVKMPHFLHPLVQKYSKSTTKLTSFLSGIVIGLCTIPCSGAIYMAIIFILNTESQSIKYPLLLIYNLGFILPVVLLAFTVSNKRFLTYLSQDFIKSKNLIRIIIGIITIILGVLSIYLV